MVNTFRFIAIGMTLILVGCSSNNSQEIKTIVNVDSISNVDYSNLMINNCYSCHNPSSMGKDKIAPPLAHIKEKYQSKFETKDEFISAMSSFVINPSLDNAIMKGAIDKFGVMPNMQFTTEDANNIASYIYANDIESDEWLAKNYNGTVAEPTFENGDYMGLGRHIVMSTKKQLGKNLKKTIKNKGTFEAVSYCNVRALPITDSMATKFGVVITRVSDKQRNSFNVASALETGYITEYQSQLDNGEELKPILNETNDLATFYMPIVTNEMCLQCHGNKSDIDSDVLNEINKLYPKDLALGYGVNQIRGIWKIEINK